MTIHTDLLESFEDWEDVMDVIESIPAGQKRKTRLQVSAIDAAIMMVCEEYDSLTVRQLYYQLVSRGIIEKTEAAYKNLTVKRSVELRKEGLIRYGKFSDATRWQRRPTTYRDIEDLLLDAAKSYRKSIWQESDQYVEVWCEKDALSGIIYDVTEQYDIPLMSARGYSSLSFLHSAACEIKYHHAMGKDVCLYHLGDFDPSGQDAARAIKETLRDMARVPFDFVQLAVTPDQIDWYELPERPTKKSDSRAKEWEGGSVELDAINPNDLRKIVRDALDSHIDENLLARTILAENAERETIKNFASHFKTTH